MAEPCFRLIVDGKKLGVFRQKQRGRFGYLEHRRGVVFEKCLEDPSLSLSKETKKQRISP